jgi:uncharacterized protein
MMVPASELLSLALAVAAAGVVTGLLAGLFRIGGGAVTVPVLFEIFRVLNVSDTVRMQLCVGTSLAIILPTALRSYRAHLKRGSVIAGVVRLWALPTIVGVGVGSFVAAFAPAPVFKIAFVIIAAINLVEAVVWRRLLAVRRRTARPAGHDRLRLRDWLGFVADGH